jgi:hypothetical protein
MLMAAVSGNTLALYAVIVSAVVSIVVGFGGPVVQGRLATRRQRDALLAAENELQARLTAESKRLDQTLAADHRKTTYEAERQVLDDCAVFLQRFNNAMRGPGMLPNTPEYQELANDLGSHLARLKLWFADQTAIVQSFQLMLGLCGVFAVEAPKWRQQGDTKAIDAMEKQIGDTRNRYLDAAREHLRAS